MLLSGLKKIPVREGNEPVNLARGNLHFDESLHLSTGDLFTFLQDSAPQRPATSVSSLIGTMRGRSFRRWAGHYRPSSFLREWVSSPAFDAAAKPPTFRFMWYPQLEQPNHAVASGHTTTCYARTTPSRDPLGLDYTRPEAPAKKSHCR